MDKEIAERNGDISSLKEEIISNFTLSIKSFNKIFDEKLCELILK